jgi:carbon storage regulator
MLVLQRSSAQSICISGGIKITILSIHGKNVKVGIEAPEGIKIFRSELLEDDDVESLVPRRKGD